MKALTRTATTPRSPYWPEIIVWDENILNREPKSLLLGSRGKILSNKSIQDAPGLKEAFLLGHPNIILLGV
jgi:hypothetical protein